MREIYSIKLLIFKVLLPPHPYFLVCGLKAWLNKFNENIVLFIVLAL